MTLFFKSRNVERLERFIASQDRLITESARNLCQLAENAISQDERIASLEETVKTLSNQVRNLTRDVSRLSDTASRLERGAWMQQPIGPRPAEPVTWPSTLWPQGPLSPMAPAGDFILRQAGHGQGLQGEGVSS